MTTPIDKPSPTPPNHLTFDNLFECLGINPSEARELTRVTGSALQAGTSKITPAVPLEPWLRTHAVLAYDALKADPARGLTSDQVRAKLGLSNT